MLLAAVAAFAGAAVQSATGFGFALVLSPALFAVLDPYEAVTALLLLGLALNLLVLFDRGRPEAVRWDVVAPALLAAVPGLAAGAVILELASKPVLQIAVGVAVMAAAAWQLRGMHRRPGGRLPLGLAAGFASGALTTSISINGPPLVLWLESRGLTPVELRTSLAASFLGLNLAGWLVLAAAATADSAGPGTLLPLLVLVLAGWMAGARVFRRLDPARFRVTVLTVVLASGLASAVAGGTSV